MNRYQLLFCTALLAVSATSVADETIAADDKDNVIVYGVRLDQAATETGSSVSIITAEEMDALAVDFVVDAIARAPGVTVNQNGAFGGTAFVRIRGASSEHTLVIIDGVVANDTSSPGGGYDFARLDSTNIERIEVLKGPQSTLWGTDAIGGVVNIITKRSQDGFSGKVFAQAGSFDMRRGGGEISGASERFDFRLAASTMSTDGISRADEANGNTETDGYDSTTVSASGGVALFGEARLQAGLLWNSSDAAFDSFVFGAQGNVGDGDEKSETEELTANVTLQLPMFNGRLDNRFLAGYSDLSRDNFADGLPSFSNEGDRRNYRYQGTLDINDRNRLAFGAEREETKSTTGNSDINGLFALYEVQALDALTLTAGVRHDDHDRFGGKTTGRFAVAYNPHDQVTLRTSWGEGFKVPTLFQTTFFCCGATEPNPNLQPEESTAFDIGVTFRSADERGEIGLTWFDQDTTNLITFAFGIGGYENIATATSQGVELEASYRFADWLGAALNYSFIDAKDGAGQPLIRVPEHSGDIALSIYPDARLSSTLLVRYNGKEQDPNGVVDAWTRLDLSARFKMTESVELYARVENLLDEQYQQVIGYGTPGLSGYLGAELRF